MPNFNKKTTDLTKSIQNLKDQIKLSPTQRAAHIALNGAEILLLAAAIASIISLVILFPQIFLIPPAGDGIPMAMAVIGSGMALFGIYKLAKNIYYLSSVKALQDKLEIENKKNIFNSCSNITAERKQASTSKQIDNVTNILNTDILNTEQTLKDSSIKELKEKIKNKCKNDTEFMKSLKNDSTNANDDDVLNDELLNLLIQRPQQFSRLHLLQQIEHSPP